MSDSIAFCQAAWSQIQRAANELGRSHLRGVIEALVFAAPAPLTLRELTRATKARRAEVREILDELMAEFAGRGFQLRETQGGFTFLTNPTYGQLVRGVSGQKPLRMTRAQLETLAIIAYRQPVTRPEIDDVRGVDSGPVLRTLLERDLVRVLGKKEEPGRPLLYGTTESFLDLLGLKSLADLPTLREFTELTDESRDTYERRLGESPPAGAIAFDDEPDEPIDPTQPLEEEREPAGDEVIGAGAASAPEGAEEQSDDRNDDDLEDDDDDDDDDLEDDDDDDLEDDDDDDLEDDDSDDD